MVPTAAPDATVYYAYVLHIEVPRTPVAAMPLIVIANTITVSTSAGISTPVWIPRIARTSCLSCMIRHRFNFLFVLARTLVVSICCNVYHAH
ncbi:MAG: hypothetical protein U9N35_00495 [Euryarchaeota archaeon]|nr:hypothetical protein [Euryarchaeota archaeon]